MEKKMKQKTMKLRAAAVFFATLLVTMGCVFLLNQSQEKQARLKAAYTAESTVNMVESQLNKYLVESDLMKNVVESGYDITDEQFNQLAALMQNENEVIEAYEMAKDGTINQIYPDWMLLPRQGVYVTRVLLDGVWRPSATGLGTRPTVNGDGVTCETFIPDISGDIYGDRVPVRFCRFLWPTQKFGTLEELSAMVGRAAQAAREWREK